MISAFASRAPGSAQDVWMPVEGDGSVRAVRRRAMLLAGEAGFDDGRAGEVGIVATELASNLAKHAGQGHVVLRLLETPQATGVELISIDSGPGRRNLRALVADGETTAGTLGIGLGAVQRMAGTLHLHSLPGHGTVVAATLWPSGVRPVHPPVAGLVRPLGGQEVSGDVVAHRRIQGGHLVMLADGLGHGPMAAEAGHRAAEAFTRSPTTSPGDLIRTMHRALSSTRGAAVAVVRADLTSRTWVHAGVGNIAGRLLGGPAPRSLVAQPGIVGHKLPTIRELTFALSEGPTVVLHSDGLNERWDAADLPGVLDQSPAVVAGALMRDAATRRDDASVLVLQAPEEGATS